MKLLTPITFLPFLGLLLSIHNSVAQPLDKSAIKAIDLQITDLPMAELSASDKHALHEKIIANLSQWRFPLRTKSGQSFTHILYVEAGDSKFDQTPVGFSMSLGNADPRAPGFQKANVIPIQCRLIDKANPKQEESLEMTFSAPSKSSTNQQLQESLTDNISSVCFDLLDSLKFLPPPTPTETSSTIAKPTWMPSVQVETVVVPEIKPTPEKSPVITPIAAPSVPAKPSTPTVTTTTTTAPPPASATEPQETRKQLIIHNQGTPVIIKFGYERP